MARMFFAVPLIALTALAATAPARAHDAQDAATSGNVTPLLTQALADVEGKEVSMLTVTYPPGGASSAHRHNADVFVYVIEGAVVMQVDGSDPATLTAGQTFHETPSDVHRVSRNASDTKPAKILAILIKDQSAPATVPVK
jgi:quercetin dioxygenase-like cupin family protein